jgi:hypothetical protein
MTVTGLVMIPLGLLIILLPWRYSLLAFPAFSIMNSAGVVNVGSFGLLPGYFFGMLVVARTAVEIVLLPTPLNAHVIRWLTPLFLFTMICFVSIWVGLTFFQGKIMVISSEAGFNLNLAQPYTFQRQNLTQPFYLVLNLAIVYALAHQVARLAPGQIAATLHRGVIYAILFASAVSIWEMAGFYYGVPFFASFFHSNVGYEEAHGQVLFGNILRVSGPFSEPSVLAYRFAGFVLYAWYVYLRRPSTRAMGILLLCVTMMLASTSTSAYATLGVFVLLMVKDLAVKVATGPTQIRLSMHHVGVAALLGIAALGALVFIQSYWYEINNVLTRMVVEKHHSGSFAQRTGAEMLALDILIQTGGIGIGLGGHRPSTLIMALLSNTGIAGFLIYSFFLFQLLRPRQAACAEVDLQPYRWMTIGMLLVGMISSPAINSLALAMSFGMIIGALVAKRQPAADRPVSTWRTPLSARGGAPTFSSP